MDRKIREGERGKDTDRQTDRQFHAHAAASHFVRKRLHLRVGLGSTHEERVLQAL